MYEGKDINWIYTQIQNQHDKAKWLEKRILGKVMGLFDAAPEKEKLRKNATIHPDCGDSCPPMDTLP